MCYLSSPKLFCLLKLNLNVALAAFMGLTEIVPLKWTQRWHFIMVVIFLGRGHALLRYLHCVCRRPTNAGAISTSQKFREFVAPQHAYINMKLQTERPKSEQNSLKCFWICLAKWAGHGWKCRMHKEKDPAKHPDKMLPTIGMQIERGVRVSTSGKCILKL